MRCPYVRDECVHGSVCRSYCRCERWRRTMQRSNSLRGFGCWSLNALATGRRCSHGPHSGCWRSCGCWCRSVRGCVHSMQLPACSPACRGRVLPEGLQLRKHKQELYWEGTLVWTRLWAWVQLRNAGQERKRAEKAQRAASKSMPGTDLHAQDSVQRHGCCLLVHLPEQSLSLHAIALHDWDRRAG